MPYNVLDYLRKTASEKPDAVAFSDGTQGLTFGELQHRSRSIGSALHRRGIYKKPVVVFMQKSPQEVSCFFGVIAAGCFYVPIDDEMPAARIELILENVQAPLMICDGATIETARALCGGGCAPVLYDDLIETEIDAAALDTVRRRAIDTDPIYIVFTSGSTGVPKGVAACHRSVIDYIEHLSEILAFDEHTIFGNQTPFYLDACLKEIYPTIKFGATTFIIPKRLFSLPVALVTYLNDHQINTICWVVSALTMISAFDTFATVTPTYLHTVAFGSEVFPVSQFKIWRDALPRAAFTNLYGPTEGTGMCCYHKVSAVPADGGAIPIGLPFPNCDILLLDEQGRSVPPGEAGEICIRGTGVTLGYYNDPVRTGDSFVQNPLNAAYPELIYKTGDIGSYNELGELMFVSRRDHQLKHMGHRIELGEIEACAAGLVGVRAAVCVYDKKRRRIVLYFCGALTGAEVSEGLKAKLPRYMYPNRVVKLDDIPLTANGKTDRETLRKQCEDG